MQYLPMQKKPCALLIFLICLNSTLKYFKMTLVWTDGAF